MSETPTRDRTPWVWAPHARTVTLRTRRGDVPMKRDGDRFHAEGIELENGERYAFVLDDGEPLPDPRSRWQPSGVHGASAWLALPPLADDGLRAKPLSEAVIYEMHVGTFSAEGTFDGAIAHLDALVALGVTHVELMPVAEFSGERGWGYDGVDLFAPHHAYGGPEGLRRLVAACHQRGLGVVLDVVYNHLGPSGNYLERFGPYFTDRHLTPWGKAVNLDDEHADEVRAFFVDNALMWLRDYRMDGLRLDAIHELHDRSAVSFLEQLTAAVAALSAEEKRPLVLIAESDLNDPRVVRERSRGGVGLDAQWCDDLHHAVHATLTGERTGYYDDFGSIGSIAAAWQRGYVLDGVFSGFRKRTHGRRFDQAAWRLVGSLQTHDQVGNRAVGERIGHLCGPELARVGAALVLLAPHTPMLFQGEEWGASAPFLYFTAHEDEALAAAVSEGRRREFRAFGWNPDEVPDPQDPPSFQRSKLDWAEATRGEHAATLALYRELLSIRREHLSGPREAEAVEATVHEEHRTLVLRRGPVAILANLGEHATDMPHEPAEKERLTTGPGVEARGDAMLRVPPRTAVVLVRAR